MAAINWTRLLVILLTMLVGLVLVSFGLWVIFHFVSDLLLLFVAAILAYLLTPLVEIIQARLRLPRPLAILAAYVAIAALAVALGALFVPAAAEQARALQARLPALMRELTARSNDLAHLLRLNGINLPIHEVTGNAAGAISGAGPLVLGGVLNLASSVGTALLESGLVLVITFYLINDRDTIGHVLSGIVPQKYAPGATFAARSAGRIIGRYVRAQLAVAAMVGFLGGGGAAVLGVQYAPLIGIFAFLAESIPVLGPIMATIPAVVIALLESPWKAVAVLIWFIIVQQLEQNVIMPRLSGHAVGIHPVAAIMAVLIGFQLGSVWGALFAVPILGYVVALAREAWRVYVSGARSAQAEPASDQPAAPEARVEVAAERR